MPPYMAMVKAKMFWFGSCDRKRRLARCAHLGLALGLMAASPLALGQKTFKCSDGAGGVTFQQSPCPETAKEAEARQKERERLQAEELRKKEDEARRKEEATRKARERDKAYQERANELAQERKRIEEAERRLMQGTGQASGAEDAELPPDIAKVYPGPWREDSNATIATALGKVQAQGCGKFRYRQRAGGGAGEYLVHCTSNAASRDHYFVWPQSGAARGPVKL